MGLHDCKFSSAKMIMVRKIMILPVATYGLHFTPTKEKLHAK